MLIDCERMASVWTLASAQSERRKPMEARARAIAGLWGPADGGWNARDEEYSAEHSKVLHYTTIHTQPWQPFPQRFVYQHNAVAISGPILKSPPIGPVSRSSVLISRAALTSHCSPGCCAAGSPVVATAAPREVPAFQEALGELPAGSVVQFAVGRQRGHESDDSLSGLVAEGAQVTVHDAVHDGVLNPALRRRIPWSASRISDSCPTRMCPGY